VRDGAIRLALAGDVMLARGVDQILPNPGDPTLWESYVRDARDYVRLAEVVHGPIPVPVDFAWPWGDALDVLTGGGPDVRILNLETAVTSGGSALPAKGIHYRMHPDNLPCLAAAAPDACVLANNHVLDFGRRGLADTLDHLASAGLRSAGAGHDAEAAWRPAVVPVTGGGRVVIVAFGTPSSGIPPSWAATRDGPGVAYVPELSKPAAFRIAAQGKRPGDILVASVHWGSNWGYAVDDEQVAFAHALVDAGVDVVHGHSSHHPRPIEIYRHRLVLYGCGDLVNDYEGIGGHAQYRPELRLLYLATMHPEAGLRELRMVPLRARCMRLHHATQPDGWWLAAVLDRISRDLGTRVACEADGMLAARPIGPG
jgi:poly-gamma-glutamate capsule biosynthesis protein CapA/YwtB (metallophosphatase superfamily)